MPRYWLTHWQERFWRPEINYDGEPIKRSGSNNYRKRGVKVGDTVYVVSIRDGQLYLGGRMVVRRIISRGKLVRELGYSRFHPAKEWIHDTKGGTRLNLFRRLAPQVTRMIRCINRDGVKPLVFVNKDQLDRQATRGIREVTPESARLLDRIIKVTDRMPRDGQLLTVTKNMINGDDAEGLSRPVFLPDDQQTIYLEGKRFEIKTTRYERNRKARWACLNHYGHACQACGLDFEKTYGEIGEGIIQVHHLTEISKIARSYEVDPIKHLRPICPNCHALVHRKNPPMGIDKLKALLLSQRKG